MALVQLEGLLNDPYSFRGALPAKNYSCQPAHEIDGTLESV